MKRYLTAVLMGALVATSLSANALAQNRDRDRRETPERRGDGTTRSEERRDSGRRETVARDDRDRRQDRRENDRSRYADRSAERRDRYDDRRADRYDERDGRYVRTRRYEGRYDGRYDRYDRRYVYVDDWRRYRLPAPPRGHRYARIDRDIVLVAEASRRVVEVIAIIDVLSR